ncbi:MULTISPECIES: LysR substrate-binding domain-containing protein [Shewanella]|uniref:LysR substrate-binding domain-containing protein n=1 Tax=Shewanella indica TaxID=768528 RepID=A0ABU4QD30_9GAMM|nr:MULTISPECIES: LysR substrate-binding domain-containing protein [Shewanella]NDO73477.1 LysR family transcriptional regulator [Shewanella sp. SE1]OIN17952.1 LysR family transcriptional regulator [Shewanella algae]BCV35333.1 transcriptional regulator [Shewanella chilikensis]MDX6016758.1 LysR substrate-binding domain-containing protein [Shewanella indica]TVP13519.1 LysR family transcriptional regulator [Shewanella sp. MSW]
MKIDDLRLFLSVVDLGSFAAAASSIGVPRAYVSRRIGELEADLGSKLFTRTTRKLTLTPTGEIYYQQLLEIIPRLESLNESIKNQRNMPTGSVKLGLIGDADIVAHNLLQEFLRTYPLITLETHVSNLGYHDILTYGLDACVHIGEMKDSSFVARPLMRGLRKLYASPDYIAEHGMPTSIDDLDNHALIIHRLANGELEDKWIFNQGEYRTHSRLISNNSSYVKHAVMNGAGISLLAELSAAEHVKSGELQEVLPECEVYVDDVWLVYPSRKGMTHAARLLIDSIIEEARKLDL